MTYAVKEIFYTLQGEGQHAGRPAVFCRMAGCNLWSGLERDRHSAACNFCDTDFIGTSGTLGGKYRAEELADALSRLWPAGYRSGRFAVITGGEPLLQVDTAMLNALHAQGFYVAVESNGTVAITEELQRTIDWLCISPKAGTQLAVTRGDELKVVVPQQGLELEALQQLDFQHFRLQPMDCADPETNSRNHQWALAYCLQHPQWKLSIQTHKILNIR